MKAKKWDIVVVEWVDSVHDSGWQKEADFQTSGELLVHYTTGFLLQKTAYSYCIAQSAGKVNGVHGRNIDNVMEIPKQAVIAITCLKRGTIKV